MKHIYLITNKLRIVSLQFAILCAILITSLPSRAQVASVTLTSSNDLSCQNLSSMLHAMSTCNESLTYLFVGPNDFNEVNLSGFVTVTVSGVYSVTATNDAGTCVASNTVLVGSSIHPDYQPLVDFYYSTGGPNWYTKTGWLTNCDPCSGWFGVTCTNSRVTSISLTHNVNYAWGNNLQGTLPSSIGNLNELKELNISYNTGFDTGTIPSSFTALSKLQKLDLTFCRFTGTVLDKVTKLNDLENLNLSYNQFSENIPASISVLTKLKFLYLSGGRLFNSDAGGFTGTIPVSLGQLTDLQHLDLSSNQLTGQVPSELGNLTNLTWFSLRINRLTGNIPASLGNLTNVANFDLSSNQFTGDIPASLGSLINAEYVDLSSNQLTGAIPGTLASLNKINTLHLGSNQLSGSIPAFLGTLPNLYQLILDYNQLSGCIPSSLTALCGKTVLIDNNYNLPSWSEFCSTGANSLETTKDGNWFDSTVWSCGKVPTLKDYVTIRNTVTLPGSLSGQSRKIIYTNSGRLRYGGTGKLRIGQ
ncbi:leucine-rich repeat domain-containing protein [Spirosoma flavus]